MTWSTACPDWEKRLINRESIIPPPIFPETAQIALDIFKQLRIIDLPGRPTFGECCDQWVFDFVAAIFGAYDAETGNQLIKEFYLLISKKNTKSTLAAGIMVTAVILCWREDEEHLILAPTKEVADNSFKPAASMIRADEELLDMFQVQDHIRTITHRVTKASLKVVAADTDTVSGKKSGRILVDEHWLFGKRHNADAMFMEATGGQISRPEGWTIYLTTQSDEPPAGVFADKLEYFRSVRDGKIENNQALGVLYEFPDEMIERKEYLLEENFYITNPNIGRSVSSDWLKNKLSANAEKKDGSHQKFIAKHLNVQINTALREQSWAGIEFWDQQSVELSLDDLLNRCEVVVVGIDGGGLDDLLGMAVLGRETDTLDWLLWSKAWVHPIALERRKENVTKYEMFGRDGDLVIVDSIGDDMQEVGDIVVKCEESGLLDRIGVDPSGIGDIVDEIVGRDIDNDRIVGVSQGWRLNGAIKTCERKLAESTMWHSGQKMMSWCVSNAKCEPKGNAVLITKQASGTGKIDPVMAMLNAVALMAMNPEARGGKSVYENRGILTV